MKNLCVASWSGFSGKTAFCLGLALKLIDEGLNVGYFRPTGRPKVHPNIGVVDEDVYLMKKVLNLPYSLETLCPILLEPNFLKVLSKRSRGYIEEKIISAYNEVSEDKDIMIIEGGASPTTLASFGLSTSEIARKLNAEMLLISNGDKDSDLDEIFFYKTNIEAANVPLLGVVFNQVPHSVYEKVRNLYTNFLKERNINTLGVIPETIKLVTPTVKEVIEVLGGEILVKGKLDRYVENILIGAMKYESALSFFTRTRNKAVITGGDRPEIILAALETDSSVIILSGNIYPGAQVLSSAEERDVTVILLPHDTYTIAKKLETLTGKIKPEDTERIRLSKEVIEKYVNWKIFTQDL
ncbi:MAG: phosphotransacetylase family protein [Candidatus Odinarchaeia archaeon]